MKRIIYSCFLLAFFFCSTFAKAQAFSATVTPQAPMCSTPSGLNNGQAGVTAPSPGLNVTYTWTIVSPLGSGPTPGVTFTVVPPAAGGTASLINVTYTGCGQFSLTCRAYNSAGVQQDILSIYENIICPSTGTVTASQGTVCPGGAVTLTVAGPSANWGWSTGATGSVVTVNPLSSTCYTAVGLTPQNCTFQASYCVTVQPVGVTISPPSQTICAGVEVTLTAIPTPPTGMTFQWTPNFGPPLVPGTAATQTVSTPVNNTYSVVGSINGCTAQATATVIIANFLSLFVTAPNGVTATSPSLCPGQTTILSATSSANSYTWYSPYSPPVSGPSFTYNALGWSNFLNPTPVTYTVRGDNGGCKGSATISIGLTYFTPTLVASSPAVCAGENFTLTASGGLPNNYTFAIVPSLALICFNNCAVNQVTNQNVPTTYGVLATNSANCTYSTTVFVGITPPITITVTASSASVCATSPVTITATGGFNYTLTGAAGGPISDTTGIFVDNPIAGTVYSVVATNKSGYCKSAPATATVNMITNGTLTLTVSSSAAIICPGDQVNLTATGAPNISWTPTASIVPPATGSNVVASPTANTTYMATGDNGGGCTGQAVLTISVSSKPTVNISASSNAVCAGFNATLTASGATSYTWTGSTLPTPVYQASISAGLGPGPSPATYTVIGGSAGANCPSDPKFFTLNVAPPLVIGVSQSAYTTCIVNNFPNKYSAAIDFTATGAGTYAWFPCDPIIMTYCIGPNTTVRPPTSTCFTVTGSTSVCTGTALLCVTVIPQFTMNVTPPYPAMCYGDSLQMSVVNVSTISTVPPFTYRWTEAANAPPPSLTNDLAPIVRAYPQNSTTYTVEVFDSRACVSIPRIVTVTVLPQPLIAVSIPTVNSVPTNTVCFVGIIPSAPDNTLTLVATNINPGGLPFGVTPTYTWVSPYSSSSIITDPFFTSVTVKAPTRLPATVVYTVMSGYNGISGCTVMDTVTVRVIDCRPVDNSAVVFTTDVGVDTICSRNCITYLALSDTLAGGPQTYAWIFTGGNPSTSTLQNPVVCYDLPGPWNVQLKVSNPYPLYEVPNVGSSGFKSVLGYMKVIDIPNVTIVPPGQLASDTTIRIGGSVVLTGTNAIKYVWSPNINLSNLTGSVTTAGPSQTTQYILTGYNSKDCFSSDTINVIVIDDCGDMFVPNAFSPNGDGTNDVLKVRGLCLETMTFMIFSRWGEKVFETADINVGWDGTYHGEKMNTAVFVYRLEGKTFTGKGFSLKGNITLIR